MTIYADALESKLESKLFQFQHVSKIFYLLSVPALCEQLIDWSPSKQYVRYRSCSRGNFLHPCRRKPGWKHFGLPCCVPEQILESANELPFGKSCYCWHVFCRFCIPTVYCPSIFSSSWASGRWLSLQGSYWWELELGGNSGCRLHFGANCLRPLLLSFVSIRKKGRMTPLRVKLGIVTSWLIAVISEIPAILVMKYDTDRKICLEDWPNIGFARAYTLATLFFDFILPFTFMASVYSKVIYRLWRGSNHAGTHLALLKRRKKVTKLLLIITALHGVCLFPDTVTYVLSYFGFQYGSIAYKVGTVLVCVNSTVNPFLYSLQSERFRRSLRQLLQCCEKCLVVRCWERRDVIVVNDIQMRG